MAQYTGFIRNTEYRDYRITTGICLNDEAIISFVTLDNPEGGMDYDVFSHYTKLTEPIESFSKLVKDHLNVVTMMINIYIAGRKSMEHKKED